MSGRGIGTCKCPQSQEEGSRLPPAGITGGGELPNMGAGSQTGDSSVRAVYILNHGAVSPDASSGIQCCALEDLGASVCAHIGVSVYVCVHVGPKMKGP